MDGKKPIGTISYGQRDIGEDYNRNTRNQLNVKWIGTGSNYNPWAGNDSASRIQMFCSHLSQLPPILRPDIRRTLTGVEREYGKYTFSMRMPEDGVIKAIFDKYPINTVSRAFKRSPSKLVVYRGRSDNHRYRNVPYYGAVEVKEYHSLHQYFGFMYKPVHNNIARLRTGEHIEKHTRFLESPNLDAHGNHKLGVSANVLFSSHHSTIEDGMVARGDDFIERFVTTGIESRVGSWGKEYYPINLYGVDETYKAHPDIGERVAKHGILMALRKYDDIMAVVECTDAALRKPDYVFDKLIYAKPKAEIIDVDVLHDYNLQRHTTPKGMYEQQDKYYQARLDYSRKLVRLQSELHREHRDGLVINDTLHNEMFYAEGFLNETVNRRDKGSIKPTYRRTPLDDWRVEITFKYDIRPSVGSKITDCHGGKGVITAIWPTEDMPLDDFGRRADIMRDADSTIKRMNTGGPYEHLTNALGWQITNALKGIMEGNQKEVDFFIRGLPEGLPTVNPNMDIHERYDIAFQTMLEFYGLVGDKMFAAVNKHITTDRARRDHIDALIRAGHYLLLPPDTEGIGFPTLSRMVDRYGVLMSPVVYRASNGKFVRTKLSMLIAEMYVILLEKNGSDWAAVASPKRQHFGLLARLTNSDKYSTPGRENPVRITGEAEIRLLFALLPAWIVAELLDQPNNPAAHKAAVRSVLTALKPADIEVAVDRTKYPLGLNRAIQYITHIMKCCGIGLVKGGEEEC